MKESCIDWIGQIPEEWEVSKLEQYVDIYGRIGFRGYTTNDIVNEGEGAISYSPSNIIDYSVIDNNNTYISWSKYDESPEIQIKTGDVLYVKTGSSYGKTGIVNKISNKATINPQLVVLKPKKNTDSRLINYFLNSSVGKDQSELIVGGSTIPTITQENIKKMIFPKMSFEEQQKIADFLDKKTAQLDKVKALLEEQIQKLKDYRASLIYETVTKGLDKTVPMKDSGIDWIGQIPQGWGVSRLKYFFDIYAGGDIDERNTVDEYSENHPYPVISNSLENEGILGYTNNFRFQGDSVTVTGRGDVGKAVYRNIKFYPVVRLLVCTPKMQVDCRFATYWINSAIIEKNQTAVSQLTIQMLGELIFTNVPYVEQKKIADFLDKRTVQIDKLIQIKNQQIKNINKQRQTLIYDYVTGKRRV